MGFLLMACRRLIELLRIFNLESIDNLALSSWIAVLISLLIFVGTLYIRRIFDLQKRIDALRKENESRVLSAIIRTEEKERRAFAKEIHDGLGPILSAIKMSSSAVNKATLIEANREIFTKVDTAIDAAIVSVKEISNKLSPHLLEHYGLEKAIKSFIDNIVGRLVLKITFSSTLKNKRYDYNIEVIVYRIVCELLSNTLKYANAQSVTISLFADEHGMELIYVDDGIGFSMEGVETKGMGLFNIKSRVKSLKGNLTIDSEPHAGFLLKVTLPL
jgi:signal transduction histidine kinase